YADFAAEASGVILFIHPGEVRRTDRIKVAERDSIRPEVNKSVVSEPSASSEEEWSASLSPTQVQLVELLQFVHQLRTAKNMLRLAIIVSAWDLVKEPILPVSWVENNLPLLFQFLSSNRDMVPFRIYGISALGGDLEKNRSELLQVPVPSRRVKV